MADEKKLSDMYRTPTLRAWPESMIIGVDHNEVLAKHADFKYGTNPFHAATIYQNPIKKPLFTL
ncbi:MAG TPA: hypothetical protein VLJ21_02360, partial [Candidatus Binatia bacterium]|nr:hypothetical protein [Candidatus Binatia bacterium]